MICKEQKVKSFHLEWKEVGRGWSVSLSSNVWGHSFCVRFALWRVRGSFWSSMRAWVIQGLGFLAKKLRVFWLSNVAVFPKEAQSE